MRMLVLAQAAPTFACFVGGALVDTWAGGNRGRLDAAVRRWGGSAVARGDASGGAQPSALSR